MVNRNSQFPLVSIIITTKNEERNIANCLKSILNSQSPVSNSQSLIEIIVVDNNSTDKTIEIVKSYCHEESHASLSLRGVPNTFGTTRQSCIRLYNFGPNRAAQLNFGVRLAKGSYILFPDADMILSEEVVEDCVKKCEKEECIALYIPEKIIGEGFWIKARDFERSFYNATCIDCVRFVHRDKFMEIGGFDENIDFGPDDWDFNRRIKKTGKVSIVNSSIYHNEGEFNLRKYLNKKSHYVKSFDKYIQKWGKNDPIIRKQLGFWYRYFGVFIENGKWKRLFWHPVLAIGMYFLRFMVEINYLKKIKK